MIPSFHQKIRLYALRRVLASPEFFPLTIDFERDVMCFTRLPKETRRRAAFHAPEYIKCGRLACGIKLEDLLLYDAQVPVCPARTHFILISAFCCSTLLARYLEMIPGCLVLKEPYILGQLGAIWRRPHSDGRAYGQDKEWQRLASLCLRLLTRASSKKETIVIKAADVCNHMGRFLLQRDPRTKVVLLSVGLRPFILSVLNSSPTRLGWLSTRLSTCKPELEVFPPLTKVDPSRLNRAKASALIWLVNTAFHDLLQKEVEPSRILTLNGEDVAESPREAVQKVVRFLDLPNEPRMLETILSSPASLQHSKDPQRRYSAASRRQELAAAEGPFGEDADRAVEWAASIRSELRLLRDQDNCLLKA